MREVGREKKERRVEKRKREAMRKMTPMR